jgi:hypothetical protein
MPVNVHLREPQDEQTVVAMMNRRTKLSRFASIIEPKRLELGLLQSVLRSDRTAYHTSGCFLFDRERPSARNTGDARCRCREELSLPRRECTDSMPTRCLITHLRACESKGI